MRIIVTMCSDNGRFRSVSPEQVEKDLPAIRQQHEEAMKNDPTWPCFGGVINIDGRAYQVVP